MMKSVKVFTLVFAALICTTAASNAQVKCDIKKKVNDWLNKPPRKTEISNILASYRDLITKMNPTNTSSSGASYPATDFAPSATPPSPFEKASVYAFMLNGGKIVRRRIANVVAAADLPSKCYVCPLKEQFQAATAANDSCKRVMQKVISRDSYFSTNTDPKYQSTLGCLFLDEFTQQNLISLGRGYWDSLNTELSFLESQLDANKNNSSTDTNNFIINTFEIVVNRYQQYLFYHPVGLSTAAANARRDFSSDQSTECVDYEKWIEGTVN